MSRSFSTVVCATMAWTLWRWVTTSLCFWNSWELWVASCERLSKSVEIRRSFKLPRHPSMSKASIHIYFLGVSICTVFLVTSSAKLQPLNTWISSKSKENAQFEASYYCLSSCNAGADFFLVPNNSSNVPECQQYIPYKRFLEATLIELSESLFLSVRSTTIPYEVNRSISLSIRSYKPLIPALS